MPKRRCNKKYQKVFIFLEYKECFERLNDLIGYINEKKNSEDILICGTFPFNKTGIVHTKIEGFMTSLTRPCSEKNIKYIDNRSFVKKKDKCLLLT